MTPELSERQVEVLKMVRDRESLQWAGLKNLFDLRAFGLLHTPGQVLTMEIGCRMEEALAASGKGENDG